MFKRARLLNMLETTPMLMHPLWYQSALNLIQDKAMLEGIDDEKFISQINQRSDLLAFVDGDKPKNTSITEIRDNVGILKITSPFIRYGGLMELSGYSSTETISKEFAKLNSNNEIDAIVGVFDTGGGDARGVSELADLIKSSEKKTVAYIDANAHSAGYWVASAFDEIVSNKTAMVGSIGAVYSIKAGDNKDVIKIVSTTSPKKQPDASTEDGKAQIQVWADDLANEFILSVAENRGVSFETVVEKFGAGDSLIAKKALSAGMIDKIGNFEDLILSLTKKGETQMSETVTMETEESVSSQLDAEAIVAEALSIERKRSAECLAVIPAAYAANKEVLAMVNDGKSTPESVKAKLWDLQASAEEEIVKEIKAGVVETTEKAEEIDTTADTEVDDEEKEASQALALAKQMIGE